MFRKRRERREMVMVVLEGLKASTDKAGVAPLRWAFLNVSNPKDILVLTILEPRTSMAASPSVGFCCIGDHRHNQSESCEEDQYNEFLHQQITEKRKTFTQILRPFYDKCKSSGVKFDVRVSAGLRAAGFRSLEIVMEQANKAKATWIVMDSCFAEDLNPRLGDAHCNIALVNDDEEAVVHNHYSLNDGSGTSSSQKLLKESVSAEESEESENSIIVEPPTNESENLIKMETSTIRTTLNTVSQRRFFRATILPGLPLNLSWEEIVGITGGFRPGSCISQHLKFEMYHGYLDNPGFYVMVKRFTGDSNSILEAEMRVASSMFHQNILGLIGYHESPNTTALVYPYAEKGTLDQYLCDAMGKHVGLTFQEKMKIAIEIARCVRYMHEECPQGPFVHGDLQPYNIFLRHDFQPLISGFGRAIWLQSEQAAKDNSYISCVCQVFGLKKSIFVGPRCWHRDPSDHESIALVKSDVLSFGVLLLRLFCKRSLPKDDKHLIELARPFLLRGAFHELLDQDMEDLDMYGIYRVMVTATHCTRTKPLSRPAMTQVLSILRGENVSTIQTSPSSDGSVQRGTKNIFYARIPSSIG